MRSVGPEFREQLKVGPRRQAGGQRLVGSRGRGQQQEGYTGGRWIWRDLGQDASLGAEKSDGFLTKKLWFIWEEIANISILASFTPTPFFSVLSSNIQPSHFILGCLRFYDQSLPGICPFLLCIPCHISPSQQLESTVQPLGNSPRCLRDKAPLGLAFNVLFSLPQPPAAWEVSLAMLQICPAVLNLQTFP